MKMKLKIDVVVTRHVALVSYVANYLGIVGTCPLCGEDTDTRRGCPTCDGMMVDGHHLGSEPGDYLAVLPHVSPAEIAGKHVLGVLPLHLAALAASVTEVPLKLAPAMRGRELDIEDIRRVAGEPVTYVVHRCF